MRGLIFTKKGFSLIELIIVIAILGVIATIALPNFSGILLDSKKKTDGVSALTISHVVMEAYVDNILKTGGVFKIPIKSGDVIKYGDGAEVSADILKPYIHEGITTKSKTDGYFEVTVKEDGACLVILKKGDEKIADLYPVPNYGYIP